MKKQIYLVDYLGIHCGMDYYLNAFKSNLSQIPNVNINILSNYSENDLPPFFFNQYKGNILKKIYNLLRNILLLKRFLSKTKNGTFVYLSYGHFIDIPFVNLICKKDNSLIDIHEAISQNLDNNSVLKYFWKRIYKNNVKNIIFHSKRTETYLSEFEFQGNKIFVPHFKYQYDKRYNPDNITKDLSDLFNSNKITFLFFGNLNISKGVDIVIESFQQIENSLSQKANLIVAGKDFDGTICKYDVSKNDNIHILSRHITDDELKFLFTKCDYVTLPYRKTSQSGIIETAFHFKKPIIASNIPYFIQTLNQFPSFGILSENTIKQYSTTISSVIENHNNQNYYSDLDYANYENRQEFKSFIERLCELGLI